MDMASLAGLMRPPAPPGGGAPSPQTLALLSALAGPSALAGAPPPPPPPLPPGGTAAIPGPPPPPPGAEPGAVGSVEARAAGGRWSLDASASQLHCLCPSLLAFIGVCFFAHVECCPYLCP